MKQRVEHTVILDNHLSELAQKMEKDGWECCGFYQGISIWKRPVVWSVCGSCGREVTYPLSHGERCNTCYVSDKS